MDCPVSEFSSLALLLPFLTSRPNLGARPDCWVSMEFLRAPIPRKRSGSTTTKFKPNRTFAASFLYQHFNTFWIRISLVNHL